MCDERSFIGDWAPDYKNESYYTDAVCHDMIKLIAKTPDGSIPNNLNDICNLIWSNIKLTEEERLAREEKNRIAAQKEKERRETREREREAERKEKEMREAEQKRQAEIDSLRKEMKSTEERLRQEQDARMREEKVRHEKELQAAEKARQEAERARQVAPERTNTTPANPFGTKTWKVVYYPKILTNGQKGVALVEAVNRTEAMVAFQRQYEGQFHTVDTCEPL